MTSALALSSSVASSLNRPNALRISSALLPPPTAVSCTSFTTQRRRRLICCCEVALRSLDEEPSAASVSLSSEGEESDEITRGVSKIGSRVRVIVPLKVFHVPRVPEVDLTGMEGVVKQYVGLWKGKRISANFPFKMEFVTHVEGRGPVKFFAHLKDDEFEFLD